MNYNTFNKEMKKKISSDNSSIIIYLEEKIKIKGKSNNYYSFFSDFLYNLGISTLDYIPLIDQNKYVPYVNCIEENIFSEQKGNKNLSNKPENASQCQKIMAEYLFSKLKQLRVQNIENW